MTKKSILLVCLFVLTAICSRVQAQDVQLKIIDAVSLAPVEGVNIFCIDGFGQKAAIRSSSNGDAILSNLRFPITIYSSMIGYSKDTLVLSQDLAEWKNYAFYHTLLLTPKNFHLKKTVVTGQVNPVLGTNSVYKVNTITEEDIAALAAVNLTDVLQFEMNQFVSNDNILGASSNIGGIGAQNVKILLNGVPLNGSEAGFVDLNQINLNNVKRIETVQGPMSVMYGSNALGGVINIITKEAKKKVEFGLRSYMDNLIRFNVAADAGWNHKKHNVKFSVGRNMFQGWTPFDTLSRWMLWKPKVQYHADLSYRYRLPKGKISLYSFYLNEEIENRGVPSVSPFRAFAFDEYYKTNRIRNTINFDYQVGKKEYFKSQNTVSIYNRTKNRYYKDMVTLESKLTDNVEDQDTSIFYQYHFRGAMSSDRFKRTDLIVGYETNIESSNSTKISTDTNSTRNGLRNMGELGLFVSANYKFKKVSIMPSVRLNMHSYFAQNISYGIHVKYSPTESLQYRASIAQGYRTPTIKELYLEFIDNNHRILGNESLQQEEGLHAEISGEKKVTVTESSNLILEGSAVYNELRNKISLTTLNATNNEAQYFNIEEYANFVTFFRIKYASKRASGSLGMSRTLILRSTGLPANSFAELLTSISYTIPTIETRVNAFYRYTANQPIYFVDGTFAMSRPLHISNISLSKDLLDSKMRLQIGLKNVFNIQNNILAEGSGSGLGGSPHGGENTTTLMLPRSIFFEVLYKI